MTDPLFGLGSEIGLWTRNDISWSGLLDGKEFEANRQE
jgi:hypothetical protein